MSYSGRVRWFNAAVSNSPNQGWESTCWLVLGEISARSHSYVDEVEVDECSGSRCPIVGECGGSMMRYLTGLTKDESPHTGYTFTPWVVSFTPPGIEHQVGGASVLRLFRRTDYVFGF